MQVMHPYYLVIAPIISILFILFSKFQSKKKQILIPYSIETNSKKRFNLLKIVCYIVLGLSVAVISILIARPYKIEAQKDEAQFREIVFVIDISGSMDSYLPQLAKNIEKLINQSQDVKFGIVYFSSSTYAISPLTADKQYLIESIRKMADKNFYLYYEGSGGGTNITNGLKTGIYKFPPKSKSDGQRIKTLILVSDGDANQGEDPKVVVPIAKKEAITMYTLMPKDLVYSFNTEDSGLMKDLATSTKGKFFEFSNSNNEKIINEINNLEKSKIKVKSKTKQVDNPGFYTTILGFLVVILSILVLVDKKRIKK